MVGFDIWALMSMAFGLGMLHALDADHVIAVSGLSCYKQDRNSSVLFCTRWALGHGGALLFIGTSVIFLGMVIPEALSAYAESLVGVVLIVIGVLVLLDIYRQHAHLHFHQHDNLTDHAHWHKHLGDRQKHQKDKHQHSHAPVFVGILHGAAGSAPLLVLLPLSKISSPWLGIGYLLIFGLSVFLAMLVFGGLLGRIFTWMQQKGDKFIKYLRITISFLSIVYGMKLIATMIL